MTTKRSFHALEAITLLTVGIVYWLQIYPRARREIRRWKRRANAIPDVTLRDHAVHKLTGERLNPEAAAFFAVLAPRRHRGRLVRLMVAFQIAYDYLDAINEEPETSSLHNGLWLHRALNDAVGGGTPSADYYRHHPHHDDGGYLIDLVHACQAVIATLPSGRVLESVLIAATKRCGEAQSRNHAVQMEGNAQLIDWTDAQAGGQGYLWWELAAGGISCLAIHALFAAASRKTTLAEGRKVDAAYFPPVCAISALLDSLIDYADDAQTANHSFTGHYETRTVASRRFAEITTEARMLLGALPDHRRHFVLLAGVASFYLSAPEAQSGFAQPVTSHTLQCLGPITVPILAVMRLMRRHSH